MLKSNLLIGFGATPSYDPDAAAFFAATGLVDLGNKAAINAWVIAGKANGWWSIMGRLHLLAAKGATPSLTCVKSLATLTAVNGPTRNDGLGYTFNGSNQYLQMDAALNAIPNLTQTSASIGGYVRARTTTGSRALIGGGTSFLSNGYAILFYEPGGTPTVQANMGENGANLSVSNAVYADLGLWHANRDSNATTQLYRNGSQVDTDTPAGNAPPNFAMLIGAANSGGSPAFFYPGQLSFAFAGGSMNSTIAAAFAADFAALQAAMGF